MISPLNGSKQRPVGGIRKSRVQEPLREVVHPTCLHQWRPMPRFKVTHSLDKARFRAGGKDDSVFPQGEEGFVIHGGPFQASDLKVSGTGGEAERFSRLNSRQRPASKRRKPRAEDGVPRRHRPCEPLGPSSHRPWQSYWRWIEGMASTRPATCASPQSSCLRAAAKAPLPRRGAGAADSISAT